MNDATFDPNPAPQQRSWFSRNKLWFIPLMLVAIAVPVVCCGGTVGVGMFGMKIVTQARAQAVDRLNADAAVTEKLGSPITAGNDLNMNNQDLSFSVSGPNGSAEVSTTVTQQGTDMIPGKLTVTCDDGTVLEVP